MNLAEILKESVKMVIPKWLRGPKCEPSMKDLRAQVQQAKSDISRDSSVIIERARVKRSGKTIEISQPVPNGST